MMIIKKVYLSLYSSLQYTILLLIGLSLLFATSVNANDLTYPKMQGAITDLTQLFDKSELDTIDRKIMTLEHETGAQLAVLIIPTTGSQTIEQYAVKLFNHWRLGRQDINDSVLLLVTINDRAVRIEVGYGLEGELTDLTTHKIINEYILPYFKQQQYVTGIDLAVDALIAKIKQQPLPAIDYSKMYISSSGSDFGVVGIIAAILIGSSLILWLSLILKSFKSYPLKAGIPIAGIFLLTWYYGGFDFSTPNGMVLSNTSLTAALPAWTQLLLTLYLPSWLAIIMIFSCFIVAVFMILMLMGGFILLASKILDRFKVNKKLKMAIGVGLFMGMILTLFLIAFLESVMFGLLVSAIITVFIIVGIYTGKIKPSVGGQSSSRHSGSSYKRGGYSSSGSSSRSSGGGGRSGGGGSSGRW